MKIIIHSLPIWHDFFFLFLSAVSRISQISWIERVGEWTVDNTARCLSLHQESLLERNLYSSTQNCFAIIYPYPYCFLEAFKLKWLHLRCKIYKFTLLTLLYLHLLHKAISWTEWNTEYLFMYNFLNAPKQSSYTDKCLGMRRNWKYNWPSCCDWINPSWHLSSCKTYSFSFHSEPGRDRIHPMKTLTLLS